MVATDEAVADDEPQAFEILGGSGWTRTNDQGDYELG
jgi:hypothetical protein